MIELVRRAASPRDSIGGAAVAVERLTTGGPPDAAQALTRMVSRLTALRTPDVFLAKYGPWAVVTGASSGIDRGIVTRHGRDRCRLCWDGRSRGGPADRLRRVGTSGAFLVADRDDEFAMLDVNCRAVMALSLHFGRRFADQGRGGMVLMASLVGDQGTPGAAHSRADAARLR